MLDAYNGLSLSNQYLRRKQIEIVTICTISGSNNVRISISVFNRMYELFYTDVHTDKLLAYVM